MLKELVAALIGAGKIKDGSNALTKALHLVEDLVNKFAAQLPEGADIVTPVVAELLPIVKDQITPERLTEIVGEIVDIVTGKAFGKPWKGGGSVI